MTPIERLSPQERDPETYAIIGTAMMIHRTLGRGFLEQVYQEAMEVELHARGIPHEREVEIPVHYGSVILPVRYRADFICFGRVLVELKALCRLTPTEESQIINYLTATRLPRGLLLNFGSGSLQYRRFAGRNFQSVTSVKSVDSSSSVR